MIVIHKKIWSVALALVSAVCSFSALSHAQEGPAVEVVTVTGSAETRDGALVDSCRLALAKVHGGRVAGMLLKTNEKSLVFHETRDQTALTFGGLITKYSIIKEQQPDSTKKLWSIEIQASVRRAFPDRFAGRVMVRTPSGDELQQAGMNAEIAKNTAGAISGWFANCKQYALLERSQEGAIDEELNRAASEDSAVREKSKLSSQKAADIVIVIEEGNLELSERSTNFKNLSRQSHTCTASVNMVVKVIDVMTKGEIGRETVVASAKKSTTSNQDSKSQAISELGAAISDCLSNLGVKIHAHLDTARIKVASDGAIEMISPDSAKLEKFSALRLYQNKDGTSKEAQSLGTFQLNETGKAISIDKTVQNFPYGEILQFYPISNEK